MTVKYFNGEIELTHIYGMNNKEFADRFPGVKGRRLGGYDMMVGRVAGTTPVWDASKPEGQRWVAELMPVQRVINYKSNPSRHECDARCMNATGRTMNCECKCMGKNHGRGKFACAAE